jgi:hypothetical protein
MPDHFDHQAVSISIVNSTEGWCVGYVHCCQNCNIEIGCSHCLSVLARHANDHHHNIKAIWRPRPPHIPIGTTTHGSFINSFSLALVSTRQALRPKLTQLFVACTSILVCLLASQR